MFLLLHILTEGRATTFNHPVMQISHSTHVIPECKHVKKIQFQTIKAADNVVSYETNCKDADMNNACIFSSI